MTAKGNIKRTAIPSHFWRCSPGVGEKMTQPVPVHVKGHVREQAPAEPEHCMQCWDLERRFPKKIWDLIIYSYKLSQFLHVYYIHVYIITKYTYNKTWRTS